MLSHAVFGSLILGASGLFNNRNDGDPFGTIINDVGPSVDFT